MKEITRYEIRQAGEIIPEGDFETEAEAVAAMADLQRNLGWTRLDVVQNTVLVPAAE